MTRHDIRTDIERFRAANTNYATARPRAVSAGVAVWRCDVWYRWDARPRGGESANLVGSGLEGEGRGNTSRIRYLMASRPSLRDDTRSNYIQRIFVLLSFFLALLSIRTIRTTHQININNKLLFIYSDNFQISFATL